MVPVLCSIISDWCSLKHTSISHEARAFLFLIYVRKVSWDLFMALTSLILEKVTGFPHMFFYWICNSILHAQTRSGHLLRTPFNVAAGISFTFSSLAFLSSPPYDTLILLCHMLKAIDLSFNIHFILLQHK
jgi:hypothetical protein